MVLIPFGRGVKRAGPVTGLAPDRRARLVPIDTRAMVRVVLERLPLLGVACLAGFGADVARMARDRRPQGIGLDVGLGGRCTRQQGGREQRDEAGFQEL